MLGRQHFILPDRLGSQCSDRIMMHFVRQTNASDIMEYGFQDLGKNCHTDVDFVSDGGSVVRMHSLLLCSVSSFMDSLLSSTTSLNLKQTVYLPEVDYYTISSLCQLLYGSAIILSSSQISQVNKLMDSLGIHIEVGIQKGVGIQGIQPQTQKNRGESIGIPYLVNLEDTNPGEMRLNLDDEICSKTMVGQVQITRSKKKRVVKEKLKNIQPVLEQNEEFEEASLIRIPRNNFEMVETDGAADGAVATPENHVHTGQSSETSGSSYSKSVETNVTPSVNEKEPVNEPENRTNIENAQNVVSQSQGLAPNSQVIEEHHFYVPDSILPDLNTDIPCRDPAQEETVKTTEKNLLPLICWHCNKDFESFEVLSDHIHNHTGGGRVKRRHHRCPRCGEVLPSMWKLRQHLAQHQKLTTARKGDHPYAERSRTRNTRNTKKRDGDHGYATATCKQPEDHQLDGHASRLSTSIPSTVRRTNPNNELRTSVSNEHSYGTKRDSSPELDLTEGEEKIDHPYSAQKLEHSPSSEQTECKTTNSQITEEDQAAEDTDSISDKTFDSPSTDPVLFSDYDSRSNHLVMQSTASVHTYAASMPPRQRFLRKRRKSTKETSFQCSQCTKSFPAAYRLNRHVREVHNKEKYHKCDLCPSEFFKSTSLLRHKVAVHSDLRPFICVNCSAAFKDSTALRYHIKNNVCQKVN